jgi:hypothetical protein
MPPGRRGGAPLTLRHRLRSAFTSRLGYKAAAIFFSVIVWAAVREQETVEEIVPVRFAPRIDSTLVLVDPPALRSLIVGRGREILKLYSNPPVVRRHFGPDTPESVRLELGPTDVDLPAGVVAIVRDVQPRTVTLVFRRRTASRPARDTMPLGRIP